MTKANNGPGLLSLALEMVYSNAPRWLATIAVLFFLISAMMVCFFVFSSVVDSQYYYTHLEKAIKEGNVQRIELSLDALMVIEPDDPMIRFRFALLMEAQKRFAESVAILEGLAPLEDDSMGFDHAHMLLAKRLLLDPTKDPVKRAKAIKHLAKAISGNPKNLEARADLAEVLLDNNQWNEAQPFVVAVVSLRPELCVRLARGLVSTQKQKALDLLRLAESPLRSKLKQYPDNEELIRAVADISNLQGKHQEAADLLSGAFQSKPSEILRSELGTTLALQMATALNKPDPDFGAYLALVSKGLLVDPSNPLILLRMEEGLRLGVDTNNAINARLEELLSKGTVPDMVHLLLGTEAHRKGRTDLARLHFDLAYQANPKLPEACNNLAWYLSNESPRDLKRGLEISAQAVTMNPGNPHFRETRGQIHLLLGQWKEAITDLEFALTNLGPTPSIHQSLATAYKKMGDSKLAAIHQGQADKQKNLNLPVAPRVKRPGT